MKQCPYCGAEIPDDKSAAFCIKCDHIIDDEVFLRQQLKKELEKPKTGKGKPKSKRNNTPPAAQRSRRYDDNYKPKRYYEEKKSYANLILIAIVVVIIVYVLLK